MRQSQQLIIELTKHASLPSSQRRKTLFEFAKNEGWNPSDEIEFPATDRIANAHLIVEYGLKNTVVISFLKDGITFNFLTHEEKNSLLEISYNNLIDHHFFPNAEGLLRVNNRTNPPDINYISIYEEPDVWSAKAFGNIVTKNRPRLNVESLDKAFIDNLSNWKRRLGGIFGNKITNLNLSSLFNSIIFVRAYEDYKRWERPTTNKLLLDIWNRSSKAPKTIRGALKACLRELAIDKIPSYIIEEDKIGIFDTLDRNIVNSLIGSFYINPDTPYKYNFSLMSKHALSRIYERYISLLRDSKTDQISFFPETPDEIIDRSLGRVFTPEYIAKFFAKYIRENMRPKDFRNLIILDPSCGSGIFPRTILELQLDPWAENLSKNSIRSSFEQLMAIDVEPNACQATRLSLALLYMIIFGEFPRKINIINEEAISYFDSHKSLKGCFDVVVTNPPFVSWDRLTEPWRKIISTYMANYGIGKMDLFLAFLKLGMDALKDNGYLLYVLPHSFLISENAKAIRKEISENFNIVLLADLSQVPVFNEFGSYVILLIIQKKSKNSMMTPEAICVRAKEFVGHALQDALAGNIVENDSYNVFKLNQNEFLGEQWVPYDNKKRSLLNRIKSMDMLSEHLIIRQGMITGADDIFIRKRDLIDKKELDIYRPFLPDRKIRKFQLPKETNEVVFYPYRNGKLIDEDKLSHDFPKTWKYLRENIIKLKMGKSRRNNSLPWWSPLRPRKPENMFIPKIVSPHLIITPKFSLDLKGVYAISRSPIIFLPPEAVSVELLYYYLGILNSSAIHWQLLNISQRYGKGYLLLEKLTLTNIRLPNPTKIKLSLMNDIIGLSKDLSQNPDNLASVRQLDILVSKAFNLDHEELLNVSPLDTQY